MSIRYVNCKIKIKFPQTFNVDCFHHLFKKLVYFNSEEYFTFVELLMVNEYIKL